ncbi:hypothetical protein D3P09_16805 [Paenibacillus pinisoli]|uniref:Uncharacterized protein n=1 Tax=Paenibacillus pinisoli TaxID=1276110 RepID=A0A3A6PCL5_9BACL|nr:hypothetical protein [Paenibacillus pinisoli]RJX39152.1 hypothetical protein D3P09_16805 [Paenibacillus pinisoli]
MQIGVYGYTDKRPVIYALLKLLQATGDVALISNNRHYKRLLEHGESQGHMANIMIAISDATPDEIFGEIGHSPDDFEHIVFDIQDTIPDDLTHIIYVKSYKPDEEEEAFLDLLGDYQVFKITYDGKPERGAVNIQPTPLLWKTVENIEFYKVLYALPSKELNMGVASLLTPSLNMPPKSSLTLLNRKWLR